MGPPVAHVVHIQANEVGCAVHEVLVCRPSGVLFLDVVAVDELEVQQLGGHQVPHSVVLVKRHARRSSFMASCMTDSTALYTAR